jgi:hypothetical protein
MPDTTPTPADNLRAAAELLRDKATAAVHEGRTTWSTGYTLGSRSPVVVDDQEHPSVLIETFAARLERVNSYLALVGPATGLVVADWLDAAAAGYNATVQGAASVWTDPADAAERNAWVARQTDQHALAVARQVLGTPTTDPVPAFDRMPCSLATLYRPHPPHTWEPQPGMTPLACPGTPASAPAAPADRATDRRDRYADAILDALARDTTHGPHWGAAADAVMAVADAEQAELRAELARVKDHRAYWHYEVRNADARIRELDTEVEQWRATFGRDALPGALRRLEAAEAERDQLRTDPAARLRAAVATVESLPVPDTSPGWALGAAWALAQIRRLADEAQPTETEAHGHVWVTALDGDNRPIHDEQGRPVTHCGICGQRPATATTEEPQP